MIIEWCPGFVEDLTPPTVTSLPRVIPFHKQLDCSLNRAIIAERISVGASVADVPGATLFDRCASLAVYFAPYFTPEV